MKIILIALILVTLSLNQVHQVQAITLLTNQKSMTFKPKTKKDYILIFKKPIKKVLIINVLLLLLGFVLLFLGLLSPLTSTSVLPFLGLIIASILIVSSTVEIILDYVLPLLIKTKS